MKCCTRELVLKQRERPLGYGLLHLLHHPLLVLKVSFLADPCTVVGTNYSQYPYVSSLTTIIGKFFGRVRKFADTSVSTYFGKGRLDS